MLTRRHLLAGTALILMPTARLWAQTQIIIGQPTVTGPPPLCQTLRDSFLAVTDGTSPVGSATGTKYLANKFTASATYTLCKVVCYLSQQGAAPFTLSAVIYSHDTGLDEPASAIGTASSAVTASTIPTVETATTFPNISASIVSGTIYWLVLVAATIGSGSNYVRWQRGPATGSPRVMSDTTAVTPWTLVTSTKTQRFEAYS